jgi:MFS family permease
VSAFQSNRPLTSDNQNKNSGFYYGWIIVSLAFFNLVIAFGIWYSFAVFFIAVINDFGVTRAASAAIFSIFMMVHALAAWPVGFFIDRYGGHKIIPISAVLVAAGLWATSRSTQLWHLYLFYGVATAVGICGIGHFAHSVVLPNWFKRRRGLAIGIALAGSGVGMQIIVPLVQYIISNHGWRSAYQALAAFVLCSVVPLNAYFQRSSPKNPSINTSEFPQPEKPTSEIVKNANADGNDQKPQFEYSSIALCKNRLFWCLFFSRFATVFATQAVLVHMVAHMVDRGFTVALGAFVLGITGMIGSAAKILFGHLSDRVGRDMTYTFGLAFAGAGVLSLIMIQPDLLISVILFASFFGIGLGAVVPIFPARAADIFQGSHYGRIYGFLSLAGGTGAALGSWISGLIFDITQSYEIFFFLSIVLMICSALLFRCTNPNKA